MMQRMITKLCTLALGLAPFFLSNVYAQGPNQLIHTIPGSSFPSIAALKFIAISNDGTTAYAPDFNTGLVYPINTTNFSVIGSGIGGASAPAYIAMDPVGSKAYISDISGSGNQIDILDTANNMISGIVSGATGFDPMGIAFTSDGSKAYVANNQSNTVGSIDVVSDSSNADVNGIFVAPNYIAITGNIAYVTNNANSDNVNSGNPGVSIINVLTDTVIGTVGGSFSFPTGIAFTPDGTTAYVVNAGLAIVNYIDVNTHVVTGTVSGALDAFNSQLIAITPDGTTAYVTNFGTDTVSIINLATNTITSVVTVGNNPLGLAITPNGQEVWVVNGSDNSISIFGYVISNLMNVSGCQTQNVFFTQTDLINILTWQAPTMGTPVYYGIYRDVFLTELAGTVLATANPLQFVDHNRQAGIAYTYYIVAYDAAGNSSAASVITVNQSC
jgi:YVTN family beta-propeller protein